MESMDSLLEGSCMRLMWPMLNALLEFLVTMPQASLRNMSEDFTVMSCFTRSCRSEVFQLGSSVLWGHSSAPAARQASQSVVISSVLKSGEPSGFLASSSWL